MFKKKPKKDKYEGLHGQELVDAIMRDGTLGKPVTESQARANDRKIAELNRRYERQLEWKVRIGMFLKPIIYTPLSILFHIVTFVFRIVGGIASVAMIYGIYCGYKAFTAWRAGEAFSGDLKTAVMLIIFPFAAFAIAVIAEKLWSYFEDKRRAAVQPRNSTAPISRKYRAAQLISRRQPGRFVRQEVPLMLLRGM